MNTKHEKKLKKKYIIQKRAIGLGLQTFTSSLPRALYGFPYCVPEVDVRELGTFKTVFCRPAVECLDLVMQTQKAILVFYLMTYTNVSNQDRLKTYKCLYTTIHLCVRLMLPQHLHLLIIGHLYSNICQTKINIIFIWKPISCIEYIRHSILNQIFKG